MQPNVSVTVRLYYHRWNLRYAVRFQQLHYTYTLTQALGCNTMGLLLITVYLHQITGGIPFFNMDLNAHIYKTPLCRRIQCL